MAAVLDAASGAKVASSAVTGPNPYATGGFLLDLSATFSWLGFVDPLVVVRGVLPPCDFEVLLNRDLSSNEAPGKAAVKIVLGRYDRATMTAPTGLPAGVTLRAALAAAGSTTGSGHTHSMSHDHGALNSTPEGAGGTLGVLLALGGGLMRGHVHNFTVPAFTGNTTSTTHTHDRAYEYDHIHGKTVATTNVAAVEVANGTNLSGVTFRIVAYGFGRA